MAVLVTGGAGYIGSHTCVELLNAGYEVVVIDNFSNSKRDVIEKIKQIANKDFKFYEGDCCDKDILNKIFQENDIDACYADPSYALEKLNWKAELDIEEMCRDAYNYVKNINIK